MCVHQGVTQTGFHGANQVVKEVRVGRSAVCVGMCAAYTDHVRVLPCCSYFLLVFSSSATAPDKRRVNVVEMKDRVPVSPLLPEVLMTACVPDENLPGHGAGKGVAQRQARMNNFVETARPKRLQRAEAQIVVQLAAGRADSEGLRTLDIDRNLAPSPRSASRRAAEEQRDKTDEAAREGKNRHAAAVVADRKRKASRKYLSFNELS